MTSTFYPLAATVLIWGNGTVEGRNRGKRSQLKNNKVMIHQEMHRVHDGRIALNLFAC